MPELHSLLMGAKAYSSQTTQILSKTLAALRKEIEITAISSIYSVKGVVREEKSIHDLRSLNTFSGLVVVLKGFTQKSPEEVVLLSQEIEVELSSEILHRNVGLELFTYDQLTLMTPQLTLPHPDFHLCPENIVPAAEVWGDYQHPVLGETIFSLTKRFAHQKWGEFFAQGKSLLDF